VHRDSFNRETERKHIGKWESKRKKEEDEQEEGIAPSIPCTFIFSP